MDIKKIEVAGKQIYIFEDHNLAPLAWHDIRVGLPASPALLTLDHHTDTHLAFLKHNYNKLNGPEHSVLVHEANAMCAQVKNRAGIEASIQLIRNDEHIDFAIRTGIISHAYVVSHDVDPAFCLHSNEHRQWQEEKRDFINWKRDIPKPNTHTYQMPSDRIIELPDDHFSDMGAYSEKQKVDLALEDANIEFRLKNIEEINASLFGHMYNFRDNFILDIDLDYFNTKKSINPDDHKLFYALIRDCSGITIARESWFVEDCKLEGEGIDVNYLENVLMRHINNALLSLNTHPMRRY